MQGLTKRTKKEEAHTSRGGVCLSKLDGITDLELKGLTGFRDQVRTLTCARYLPRYSSPYIPRVGISRFSRLRPYQGLPKLPAILLKNCAHPAAEYSGCAGKLGPSAYLPADVDTRPTKPEPEPEPLQTHSNPRRLDVPYPRPFFVCQTYRTPMLSSDVLRAPTPIVSHLKPNLLALLGSIAFQKHAVVGEAASKRHMVL